MHRKSTEFDMQGCTLTIVQQPYCPLHLHPCTCHTLLFVYLFTFVIGACVAFFVCLFPLPVVSDIDRQWADTKSDCTHHIRRGLGRRLRSSLPLNLSPSTIRDISLS